LRNTTKDIEYFESEVSNLQNRIATQRMKDLQLGDRRSFISEGSVLHGIAMVMQKFNRIVRRKP